MTERTALRIAQAQLLLGEIGADALSAAASAALNNGSDSPHLRELAELGSADSFRARSVFGDALKELGLPEMSTNDAVLLLAREEARRLLSGRIAPIDAARRIWDLTLKLPDDEVILALDPFIYAASEWDDRPEDHADFVAGIMESARALLDA